MRTKRPHRRIGRLNRSLRAILEHPLTAEDRLGALGRYAWFHLLGRLAPGPILYPWVGPTCFLARPGMAGIVGNIYMGLEDYEEQAFLLHFLRPGDLFVDVGANVGAYSLLASGVCRALSMAIEPIPETYLELMRNVRVNDLEQLVTGHNVGIGSQRARLTFTKNLGVLNRVVPQNQTAFGASDVAVVEVLPLDELLEGRLPAVLKVDVEGYEAEVFHGADRTLSNSALQAIVIELHGHENRYGVSYEDVHRDLRQYGFSSCAYHPSERRLESLSTFEHHKDNTLYVRQGADVEGRLRQAAPVEVLGQLI